MGHRLYVFLRSDLESMVPGKAAAQVSHAATLCAGEALRLDKKHLISKAYREWEKEGDGFGTTIVLDGGNLGNIESELGDFEDCLYGQVDDPTYPIVDGTFTHLVPVTTCLWIFVDKEDQASSYGNARYLYYAPLYQGNRTKKGELGYEIEQVK